MSKDSNPMARSQWCARIFSVVALVGCQEVELPRTDAQSPPSASAKDEKSKTAVENDVSKLKVAELIDKLREESKEGIGYQSTLSATGFIAVDQEPRFVGGILGSAKPKASPVMRELVRRGVAALPELIEHIDDKRDTKLSVSTGLGAVWHSNEYDPRFSDPKKMPAGVDLGGWGAKVPQLSKMKTNYAVRVGDLCFIAVGQIVNRGLYATRYQPTACIVINSPVQTPALAEAVKREWAGLTVEQHKQSLLEDALTKFPSRAPDAVVRLLFYYPEEGEVMALKLLNRPFHYKSLLNDQIDNLLKSDDTAEWKALIDEFRKKYGDASADELPLLLHYYYSGKYEGSNKAEQERNERATRLLAKFYPAFDPFAPKFVNGADPWEQADLIEALAHHRSEKIDQAVKEIAKSAAQMKPTDEHDRGALVYLNRVCKSRFAENGKD